MEPTFLQLAATVTFSLAVLHTFAVKQFQNLALKYPSGSVGENVFHLLGEVEVVFGIWAAVFLAFSTLSVGSTETIRYVDGLNFTEPLFVFAIMAIAATRPILDLTGWILVKSGGLLPVPAPIGMYFSILVLGPLLGSFITEPAAMTVTALILKSLYFDKHTSDRLKYLTLAVLFVNVSIGGVLTPFAAPPVLMVAGKWGWDLQFMAATFGWKAAIACTINAAGASMLLRRELLALPVEPARHHGKVPVWLVVTHLCFLALVVLSAHHSKIFLGLFLLFLGVAQITREYQDDLKLRESLLVGFFLAGLVVLGGQQSWWLDPLIRTLQEFPLFVGTAALTAFTDNAALTYLGSQVENVTEGFKYALVAGAVAGGGLTVIANAPNPAGFAILQGSFGNSGISPLKLGLFALPPTLIAMAAFWLVQ